MAPVLQLPQQLLFGRAGALPQRDQLVTHCDDRCEGARFLQRLGQPRALAGAERARLAEALKKSRALATVVAMRHELIALWERSSASKEQLLRQLQDWCHRAEASGIASLVDFSQRLRSYA